MSDSKMLLKIDNLHISFRQYDQGTRQIELPVIQGLSVAVKRGEIVAVVGSSGSGKSLLAHALLGLLPPNATVCGNVSYDGEILTAERIRELRGRQIALVPQSVNYLDPLMKVGRQVRKSSRKHQVRVQQQRLFSEYGLSADAAGLYPFELSGGMARRVLLAAALLDEPQLLIADEPTPGLDIKLAQKALADFRRFADAGNGVLLITHDIELALEVADRIAVFYAGTTVEETAVASFQQEQLLAHPYSRALWRALPQNGFQVFPGAQPYVKDRPCGCVFGPRCPECSEQCHQEIGMRRLGDVNVRCVKVQQLTCGNGFYYPQDEQLASPHVHEHEHIDADGRYVHIHPHQHGQEHTHAYEHQHQHADAHVHKHTHDGGEHWHSHMHSSAEENHWHSCEDCHELPAADSLHSKGLTADAAKAESGEQNQTVENSGEGKT